MSNIISLLQDLERKERKKCMDSLSTVRLVARLSERCWKEVEKIFHLYRDGKSKARRRQKTSWDCLTAKRAIGNSSMGSKKSSNSLF